MHYDLKQLSALNEAVKVVEEARSVKDIPSSELMGSHLKLKELIKNKKASEAQIERSKEIERELSNRSAAATKKAKSSPEYRKRMMAEEVEELEEAKKKYDPDFWRKPGREETDMLDNVDIDQIVKWLSYARKDKPELQKTSFHTMLQMRHDRWYNGSEWKTKKRPSKQDSDKAMAKWRAGRRQKMLDSFSPEEKEKYLENEKKNQKLANQAAMLWFMGYIK